jgi:D-alanine-D-alanine ligase
VKVAVLKGGRSLERGVSLRSGARVEDALARLGHEVLALDAGADLVERLSAEAPDVAFVAMHGVGGEDGTAQELLEILEIPFTGPGAAACARCMDKALAKHAIREAGLPTPDWFAFNETAFRELGAADALQNLEHSLGFPLVVKPSRGGSSLGVKFAASATEVPQALVSAFSYDDRVLLERFVDGRELAVSLLDGEALPVVEALPAAGDRYDFEARYAIGRTRFTCPAELSDAEQAAVTEVALGTYQALGCSGFARVDLILDADGPQVLEANAIPGLTDTSLLPQAAEAAGLSFEQLVGRILDLALKPATA